MKRPGTVINRRDETVPELVFGLVRAIGVDLDPVIGELETALRDALYEVTTLHLSQQFDSVASLRPALEKSPEDARYRSYMNAGDFLRALMGRADAAALLGVREIRRLRMRPRTGNENNTPWYRGKTYVLRSLMRPEEIRTLRSIYGSQFFAISVFAPADERERSLARKFAQARGDQESQWRVAAIELMNRDEGVVDKSQALRSKIPRRFMLDVRKTFEKADLFISATNPEESRKAVRRFVELIFGHPFHTPTRDEFGMLAAYGAALRSADLSRRVGACIFTPAGECLAVGTNEAPRAGGGLYWSGDEPDGRDFQRGFDPSSRIRRELLADIVRRLMTQPAADGQIDDAALKDAVNHLLESKDVRQARIMEVVEYGRSVHAEMAAIADAAKRGIAVDGAVLYCTTFPCHECARHIVAAGISRVVYVEPYPKSRVAELYDDSIGLADRQTDVGARVKFEPFIGIGARRFAELFSWVPRKVEDDGANADEWLTGSTTPWSLATGVLRPAIVDPESLESGARKIAIRFVERRVLTEFDRRLREAEHTLANEEGNWRKQHKKGGPAPTSKGVKSRKKRGRYGR